MNPSDASGLLAALANPHRLTAFRLLADRGARGIGAGELAGHLGLSASALSFHLSQLEAAGLAEGRRQGRRISYRLRPSRVRDLMTFLSADCCAGRPELCAPPFAHGLDKDESESPMESRPFNTLFLCTGNSARSILAEALLARHGGGRFRAFSAGSRPRGEVHPYALQLLESHGFDTTGLRSKSWDEFAAADAPKMDFVFTVCDDAASEVCPVWPGQPMTAHWGVPDPAAATGREAEVRLAFSEAYRMLQNRIQVLTALPFESLSRLGLQRKLEEIGRQ